MINKIAGYRKMLGMTQADIAKVFGVSKQAYSSKERGKVPFKDTEKVIFKNLLKDVFPNILIDDIFFN